MESFALVRFSSKGKVSEFESHNQDGSTVRTPCDPSGRLQRGPDGKVIKIYHVAKPAAGESFGFAIDTTDPALDEVLLYDDQENLLRRVILSRDEARRLVREEAIMTGTPPFPEVISAVTTYTHDEKGCLMERQMRMGELVGEQTNFRYDSEGHVVEQRSGVQEMRFEYVWDERHNWTERVVWSRTDTGAEFRRSNATRREIAYYAS